ncbi:MAG: hypothetical protein CM1200mP41_01950 [Gammaproteobacteria bacterium]|nr:MAG: hypothetical protein CM1200mP41_01950 [Gammaproteobacteria bacterium]
MALFNFWGRTHFLQGFDFIAVLIGLFVFSQLLSDVRDPKTARQSLNERGQTFASIEHRRAIRKVLPIGPLSSALL